MARINYKRTQFETIFFTQVKVVGPPWSPSNSEIIKNDCPCTYNIICLKSIFFYFLVGLNGFSPLCPVLFLCWAGWCLFLKCPGHIWFWSLLLLRNKRFSMFPMLWQNLWFSAHILAPFCCTIIFTFNVSNKINYVCKLSPHEKPAPRPAWWLVHIFVCSSFSCSFFSLIFL